MRKIVEEKTILAKLLEEENETGGTLQSIISKKTSEEKDKIIMQLVVMLWDIQEAWESIDFEQTTRVV